MISRFGVILLCLSGAYCISSTFENLDFEGLKRLWSGETVIKEWNTTLDQNIIKFDANGQKSIVNVRDVVQDFMQKADQGDVTGFKSIRNTIKTAYNCTLTKYASLTAFLMFQDLWELKLNIFKAMCIMAHRYSNFRLSRTIFAKKEFQKLLRDLSKDIYYVDYDFKFASGNYQLLASHNLVKKSSKEMHNLWAGILAKKLGLKIKYKIYTDVMRTKFTNEYHQTFVDTINEIICVLNEAIKMFDDFIVDKRVQHDGSFVKNFESIRKGVNGDFIWLLRKFDVFKSNSSFDFIKSNGIYNRSWELYKDFSKSISGTLPATGEIRASGCFVENLEFEISGLKRNMANTNDPSKMYSHNIDALVSEIKIKPIASIKNKPKDKVKTCMILFRDEENSSDDRPQPSEPVSKSMTLIKNFFRSIQ